jgi:hypothetical protein
MYPAHSRLMDVENKYHLWILAPKDNEEMAPRFKIGCRRYGVASGKKTTVVIVAEKGSEEHIAEMREASDRHPVEFRIFPESLRSDVEKEFPGVEYAQGMYQYVHNHPELELQVF